jgi:hypothetical protein
MTLGGSMRLLDEMGVDSSQGERRIGLYVGNVVEIPESEAVDLLVVSAFPDDYTPTGTSAIGALEGKGISVASLARDKATDLREFSSCWLSQEIRSPEVHFRRILCFEPAVRGHAPEVVGDVFRSIFPIATTSAPGLKIAMPILASGAQGEPKAQMLECILTAATHWLSVGLPIESLKIVAEELDDEDQLRSVFAACKNQFSGVLRGPRDRQWRYDLFVSYCQQNKAEVDFLVEQILALRPQTRIFLDRMTLQIGAAWQQYIFESIDESRKVITVYSPAYLASKICKEEFNIAYARHRESGDVLLPLFLSSVEMPTYMKLIHYIDVREADRDKLIDAARLIAGTLQ